MDANYTVLTLVASPKTTSMLRIEDDVLPAAVNYNTIVRLVLCTISLALLVAIKLEPWFRSVARVKGSALPLPPGPTGLPFLGYVPFIGEKSHETFAALAAKFGPIFKINLGSQPVVILSDYKLIREAMKSKAFTERPVLRMLSQVIQDYGVVNVNGDKWRVQRQFVMRAMREMGLARTGPNRSRAEAKMTSIIDEMIEEVRSTGGAPIDLSSHISGCVGRVLLKTLWNFDLPLGDAGLRANIDRAEAGFKTSLTNLVNYFPILALSSEVRQDLKFVKNSHRETHQFFRDLIQGQKNNPRDEEEGGMIDCFVKHMEENETYYNETQLLSVLSELFSAGLETTKTTLLWIIMYVCRDPEVQRSVHQELDSVVGRGRAASLEDMCLLPYTMAVMMETQRVASITPSGLVHVASEDTTVGGYLVPRGTHLIGHQWTVHRDPALWTNPNNFDPTNFLDQSGSLVKPPYFMPFSTGRRMCLGQDLAIKDMFLIFTSLMHNFTFSFEQGAAPGLDPVIGFTLTPQQFNVVATPRTL